MTAPTAWLEQEPPVGHEPLAARLRAGRPTDLAEALDLLGPAATVRAPAELRVLPAAAAAGVGFPALTDGVAGTILQGAFAPAQIEAMRRGVLAARDEWFGHPDGIRALGRPWFAHVPDAVGTYEQRAAATAAAIDRHLPGLRSALERICTLVAGEEVRQREGWGPPGFVVFPAATTAGTPGDVHVDWEGVLHGPSGLDTPAWSLVAVVSAPDVGGGLRLWGVTGRPGTDGPAPGELPPPAQGVSVDYRPGDLVVIDGMDLHQIEAFHGDTDRICLTFHVARLPEGWRLWL